MAEHTEHSVRNVVRALIAELAPNQDVASLEDAHLVDDLEFHSLALLELAFTLEDEYDLDEIDEATAKGIQTVRDVEMHVINELRARGELLPITAVAAR